MEITQIVDNIYLVNIKNRYDLGHTFVRFQEHFESPEFKGKVFSLREYKDWYKKFTQKNKFTYCSDWAGFNIPDYILDPFYNNTFKYISKREKALLKAFNEIPKPFYIIGAAGRIVEHNIQTHEIAHGLWYLNKDYKDEIRTVLSKIPKNTVKKIYENLIKTGGYHNDVFEDESHAYLISDIYRITVGWEIDLDIKIHQELLEIHRKYNNTCKMINLL